MVNLETMVRACIFQISARKTEQTIHMETSKKVKYTGSRGAAHWDSGRSPIMASKNGPLA